MDIDTTTYAEMIINRFSRHENAPARVIYSDGSPTQIIYQGWQCPGCHEFNAPWIKKCDCTVKSIPKTVEFCPCNPANGGSGVCNCILGGLKVTC